MRTRISDVEGALKAAAKKKCSKGGRTTPSVLIARQLDTTCAHKQRASYRWGQPQAWLKGLRGRAHTIADHERQQLGWERMRLRLLEQPVVHFLGLVGVLSNRVCNRQREATAELGRNVAGIQRGAKNRARMHGKVVLV